MYLRGGEKPKFLATHKQTLSNLKFDKDGPETIVRDFEAVLDILKEEPIPITPAGQLPLSVVSKINARVAHPIELGLKRPQQKSYPPVQGLYLLLRASGLAYPDESGKKPVLVLDKTLYQQWTDLNPTERYCTLLEAWFLRGMPEIIGEPRRLFDIIPQSFKDSGQFYFEIPNDGLPVAGNKAVESELRFRVDPHNLGLMELFGLIQVEHGTPEPDKGWKINAIHRTALGDALFSALYVGFFSDLKNVFDLEDDGEVPIGLFQPILQPYFTEWKNNLAFPERSFRGGTYTFKVSLGAVWRRLTIGAEDVLDELASIILDSVDFDSDHLYEFSYRNRFGVTESVIHRAMEDGLLYTSEVKVGDLPLQIGQTMTFHFDFGDDWRFSVVLEQIDPDKTIKTSHIIETHGKPPDQYPNWEE